ncbi:MAG TPA: SAM-dependent methyltransferase [Planctomycetaceae bacterium]|jgi:23S rRNA (cytidine2498-2'-O)-methyltransferase
MKQAIRKQRSRRGNSIEERIASQRISKQQVVVPPPPEESESSGSATFVFVTCQVGAEAALKHEVAREWPRLRFAFSRPGFLTFKVPPNAKLPDDWDARLAFARAAGLCLGKATDAALADRAQTVWKLIGDWSVSQVNVWPRDRASPGFRGYEPGITAESQEVERLVREKTPDGNGVGGADSEPGVGKAGRAIPPTPPLLRGGKMDHALAADVIVVTPEEWWVGIHSLHSLAANWPGGFLQAELPEHAVSRAWLKMQEAVLWSEFPIQPGEKCVEIGSAPGGASQYLLSQGLHVTGVDPAMMDPAVLADKNFRHNRKRSKEVPRHEFVGVDWLTCDVNLPPNYTLDAVKAIVGHPGVRFQGMLLTLKLVEWSLADDLPKYIERIRKMGYRNVQVRQLHHNRQEVCLAASGFRGPAKTPKTRAKKRINPKARVESQPEE